MKAKATGEELEEIPVAYDALAVVTPVQSRKAAHPPTSWKISSAVKSPIGNKWAGDDRKIVVYSLETSSGTYEFFKKRAEKQELHEQQPFHAPPQDHHTIGQPNAEPSALWVLICILIKTLARILRRQTLSPT